MLIMERDLSYQSLWRVVVSPPPPSPPQFVEYCKMLSRVIGYVGQVLGSTNCVCGKRCGQLLALRPQAQSLPFVFNAVWMWRTLFIIISVFYSVRKRTLNDPFSNMYSGLCMMVIISNTRSMSWHCNSLSTCMCVCVCLCVCVSVCVCLLCVCVCVCVYVCVLVCVYVCVCCCRCVCVSACVCVCSDLY